MVLDTLLAGPVVNWLSGELGLVVRVLLARTSTDDPPAALAVAMNLTSPRRFGGRAGRIWCVDTYGAVVLIFFVLLRDRIRQGDEGLSRWGWIDDDGVDFDDPRSARRTAR
jgi:hypothetical protein